LPRAEAPHRFSLSRLRERAGGEGDPRTVNRLHDVMAEISDELKSHDGGQRTALLNLFEYPNM
jgi:hypothetical protein